MAIDTTSDISVKRIQTQSEGKAKKAAKRAITSIVVGGGLKGADDFFRAKATKRALDFYKGTEKDLNVSMDGFNSTIQFRADHYEKYKNAPNWEQMYVVNHIKDAEANPLNNFSTLSNTQRMSFRNQAMLDAKDDLQEYRGLLELSNDFKIDGTMDAKKLSERYYQPFEDARTKRSRKIIERGALLPTVARKIGNIFDVDSEEPELSIEEQQIKDFVDQDKLRRTSWNEQMQRYETAVSNNQLPNMFAFTESDYKLNEVRGQMNNEYKVMSNISKNKNHPMMQTQIAFGEKQDPQTTTLYNVMSQINNKPLKGKDKSQRAMFVDNVTKIASVNYYKYTEAWNKSGGRGEKDYNKEDFIRDAVYKLLADEKIQGLEKEQGTFSSFNVVYTGMDREEMGVYISQTLHPRFTQGMGVVNMEDIINSSVIQKFKEEASNDLSLNSDEEQMMIERVNELKINKYPLDELRKERNKYSDEIMQDAPGYIVAYVEELDNQIDIASKDPDAIQKDLEKNNEERYNELSKELYGVENYEDLTPKQFKQIKNPTKSINELAENIRKEYYIENLPAEYNYSFERFMTNPEDLDSVKMMRAYQAAEEKTPFNIAKEWWKEQGVSINNFKAISKYLYNNNISLIGTFRELNYDPVAFAFQQQGLQLPNMELSLKEKVSESLLNRDN
tara:strand:+ start:3722 stop:5740 length:2019 start_codon:yes stop_codon:yes gene_type:complete